MASAWSISDFGGIGSPQIAGTCGRKMPAFSKPIFSRVSPRYWVWSMSTLVMTAQSVSITFTASSRPPRPTSRIMASSPAAAKAWMMASVVNSK
ncbi:hypothetical protein D3C81_1252220 [compost metagenome]